MGAALSIFWSVAALDQRDNLTFAASLAQLPQLAQLYATSSGDLNYYDQGDLAYSLAAGTSDKNQIAKYRAFLNDVLDMEVMVPSSEANLRYSLGKIDLLLGQKDIAIGEFQEAISESHSTVYRKLKQDLAIQSFLTTNNIH
jgi:hypothetical protein